MWRGILVVVLAVVVTVGIVSLGQALAQEEGRGEGRQRDPEQMRQRMEEFRQQANDRIRQALGATEEEWAVLSPLVEKVTTLSRQSRGGGMMGFGRGRRDRGGAPAEGEAAQPQTELEKATAGLQTVLQNEQATPEEIKAALKTLRDARAKAATELEAARKELLAVVTVRQEAQLVSMGILE